MIGILSLLVPAILMLIAFAWGTAIGLGRTRARFICVAVCFVIALITAFATKSVSYADVKNAIDTYAASAMSGNAMLEELMAFLQTSEPLQKLLTSLAGAIISPLVFFVIFILLSLISWVIGVVVFIITLFIPKQKKPRRILRVAIYAVLQVMLTVFVIVTPVAAYLDCVPALLDAAVQTGSLQSESDPENANVISADQIRAVADEVEAAPLVKIYRTLGGNAMCKSLTSIKVGEETSTLAVELDGIAGFTSNIMTLTKNEIKAYGDTEAEAISNLSSCFGDSLLLPTVAGEVIFGATDAWLSEDGDSAFLGMEKPKFDDATTQMFAEAFDHILQAFHGDARDVSALCRDFDTLAKIVGILVRDGVFSSMGEESTNALVTKLSSGNTVKDLIRELGNNPSFKILISDITNIGMRAIGSSLKIPENAEAIYQEFTDDIATAMNTLMSGDLTDAEKKTQLTATIKEAFAESGNELQLDDDVIGLYADTLLEDFSDYEQVTADDVAEFFQVFAEVSGTSLPEMQEASAGTTTTLSTTVLNSGKKEYKSPAYAGKTTEQLKKESGAGLLATVLQEVVTAAVTNGNDEIAFQESVKQILTESYKEYAEATGKDASKAETFASSVVLTVTSVTEEALKTTQSMQSADDLKKVTTKVTIEDLLVDANEAASKLDSDAAVESEAEAIQKIFGSAGDILTKVEEGIDGVDGIAEIAGSLGGVLDNLSGTASFGEDKTNNLLFAVMQSETVRESANLDHKTATELAKAATEKNPDGSKPNFTDTMNSLASGAALADKLSKEGETLTEDDVRQLLDDMTPQTAGMLKSYMTEERIRSFGIPEENSALSTELIQNLLTEMGDKAKYQDSYDAETDGILKLFNMVSAVSKSNIESDHLFNRGNDKGRLDATADEVVSAVLGSNMVCNAAMNTLNKHEELQVNPFGLDINEGSTDYVECKAAVEKYYANHTDKGPELRDRLDAVAALLGVTGINYAD